MTDKEKKSEVEMTTGRLEAASSAIAKQADVLKLASDQLEEEVQIIKGQQKTQDDRLDVLEENGNDS